MSAGRSSIIRKASTRRSAAIDRSSNGPLTLARRAFRDSPHRGRQDLRRILLAATVALVADGAIAQRATEDPYLWLEEIQGPRAQAQVRGWNAATEALLTTPPTYATNNARALAILDDEAQIVVPALAGGDHVLNL